MCVIVNVKQNMPLSIWVYLHFCYLYFMRAIDMYIGKIKTFLIDSQPEKCY